MIKIKLRKRSTFISLASSIDIGLTDQSEFLITNFKKMKLFEADDKNH